jgi:hypothetical protein
MPDASRRLPSFFSSTNTCPSGPAGGVGVTHPSLKSAVAWIGGISSAPNTKPPADLVPDPDAVKKLKLLWISCGDQDGLIGISQGVHKYLKHKSVPHVWHVDSGAHSFPVWKNDLYLFSQLLFR